MKKCRSYHIFLTFSPKFQNVKIHHGLKDSLLWLPSKSGRLEMQDCKLFFSLMWQIWKERCNYVFKGEHFDVHRVLQRADYTVYTEPRNFAQRVCINTINFRYDLPSDAALIIVDGSWDVQRKMGIAVVIYDPMGNLCNFKMMTGVAQDALVAEANAILLAIQMAKQYLISFHKIHIFSDSQIVVHAVNNHTMQEVTSWHAEEVLQACIRELHTVQAITLRHARREAVQSAHVLANDARRGMLPPPCLSQNLHQHPSCFQWVLA
ncbi:hypothetical protein LUZ62_082292 [Rhynchospora pubera]|uniref:RNase H type-1 domain-containing protein n=1 Tax=Rhynchospora pubera TaxID=906938 RepID=A0AAV8C032_9POAL|nr:hypothetical protein LUZ62_082292 [Rhynchospora pubera]